MSNFKKPFSFKLMKYFIFCFAIITSNLFGQNLTNYEKKVQEINVKMYRDLKVNELYIQAAKSKNDFNDLMMFSPVYKLSPHSALEIVMMYSIYFKDAKKLMTKNDIEKERKEKQAKIFSNSDKAYIIKNIEKAFPSIVNKGEFEKTEEYNQRIKKLKSSLDNKIMFIIEDFINNRSKILISLKNYNADEEVYEVVLYRDRDKNGALAYISISPDYAKNASSNDYFNKNSEDINLVNMSYYNWAFINNNLYPLYSILKVKEKTFEVIVPFDKINDNLEYQNNSIPNYFFDWNSYRADKITKKNEEIEKSILLQKEEDERRRVEDSIESERKRAIEEGIRLKIEEEKQERYKLENERIRKINSYDSLIKLADNYYSLNQFDSSIEQYTLSLEFLKRDYPKIQINKAKFEIKISKDTAIINQNHLRLIKIKNKKKYDILFEVEQYIFNDFIENYNYIRTKKINNISTSPFKCDKNGYNHYNPDCEILQENENPINIIISLQEKLLNFKELYNSDLISKIKSLTNYKEKALLIINEL